MRDPWTKTARDANMRTLTVTLLLVALATAAVFPQRKEGESVAYGAMKNNYYETFEIFSLIKHFQIQLQNVFFFQLVFLPSVSNKWFFLFADRQIKLVTSYSITPDLNFTNKKNIHFVVDHLF